MKNLISVFWLAVGISYHGMVFAQSKLILNHETTQWYEGSILLTDGSELIGLVKYDAHTNILFYMEGAATRSFISRSVVAFEFFDERVQKQRLFYSLLCEDRITNVERIHFLELLYDFQDFAILRRIEPIQISTQSTPYALDYTSRTSTTMTRGETFYFMEPMGTPQPYVTFAAEDDGAISFFSGKDTRESRDVWDNELIVKYFSQQVYDQLKVYARENDLKFKRKEDFLKILDYCESLMKDK